MTISTNRSRLSRIAAAIDVVMCMVLFILTIAGAYGGYINPARGVLPALLCMAFPYLAMLTAAVLLVNLFWQRRLAMAAGVTLLISLPAIFTVCPMHFSDSGEAPDHLSADTFGVLTFNTYCFNHYTNMELDSVAADHAATLLLEADAGVVVMQEAPTLDLFGTDFYKVSPHLKRAIVQRYPYRTFANSSLALLSKYPFKRTLKDFDNQGQESFLVDSYDIAIGDSTVHLFNVHLQSILVSKQDLQQVCSFKNMLFHPRSTMQLARRQVMPKIAAAFRLRAHQAAQVRDMAAAAGPGPIVLCGDFNDVPGCYAMRTIMDADLHDSYADAGMGLGLTYRSHHLHFRIDHILYNGSLRPLYSTLIKAGDSDHYPIYTLFAFTR